MLSTGNGRLPFDQLLQPEFSTSYANSLTLSNGLVWVEFNTPPDTIEVISEAVFTANHLTDTDKQNSTGKYKLNTNQKKVNNLKYSKTKKTTLIQVPLTTLGQETRWAYSTMPPSLHGAA